MPLFLDIFKDVYFWNNKANKAEWGGHTCHDFYISLAASVLHVCLERAPSGVEPVTLWTDEDFLLAVWNVVTRSVTVHIRLVAKAEWALVTLKKNISKVKGSMYQFKVGERFHLFFSLSLCKLKLPGKALFRCAWPDVQSGCSLFWKPFHIRHIWKVVCSRGLSLCEPSEASSSWTSWSKFHTCATLQPFIKPGIINNTLCNHFLNLWDIIMITNCHLTLSMERKLFLKLTSCKMTFLRKARFCVTDKPLVYKL